MKRAHGAAHDGERSRPGAGSRHARLLIAGLARSPAGVIESRRTSPTMHRTFAFWFFFFPRPLAEGPG
jgi:hypothetical protein